jgi:mRNA interferase MazF
MPPTTISRRGDVVLVDFVFSDETGAKRRPVVVISTDAYARERHEVIVAAVTSNVARARTADTRLEHWRDAGLLHPSLATAILRTVKRDMIGRRLGALARSDFASVEKNLRKALGF